MKELYWTIYILAMFALGWVLAHVTRKDPPKRKVRPTIDTKHLDLDFTEPNPKDYDY